MDNIKQAFSYHPPHGDQARRYEELRSKAKEFAELVTSSCPDSMERSVALTRIQESVMWANASIAINESITPVIE